MLWLPSLAPPHVDGYEPTGLVATAVVEHDSSPLPGEVLTGDRYAVGESRARRRRTRPAMRSKAMAKPLAAANPIPAVKAPGQ